MSEYITLVIKDGVKCPVCGATELEPGTEELPWFDPRNPDAPHKRFQIRAFKVHLADGHGWYSECLICKETRGNGWFAEDGHLEQEL